LNEKETAAVSKFKSLVTKKVSLRDLRVFGSRARGEAKPSSDLDVFVVVDYLDVDTEKYITDCAWEAGFPEDILIVPVVLTTNQLVESPIRESAFIKNIQKEGIPS